MKKMHALSAVVLVFSAMSVLMSGSVACEEITLGVGESNVLDDNGLRIGFVGIPLDCRCPEGVLCIWEGDAVADLWAQLPASEPLYLELHSNHQFAWQIDYYDYQITLIAVDPYPHKDIIIDPSEYTVTLALSHHTATGHETWSVIKYLLTQ